MTERRGKISVVLIWASWCQPCIDLFPALIDLSTRYGDRGVEVTTLCLDDYRRPEEIRAAEQIVIEQNARLEHYLLREDLASAFDLLDLKELPVVRVYNREGELRHVLETDPETGALSVADLQDAIDSLL